jgi:hypothetical protein
MVNHYLLRGNHRICCVLQLPAPEINGLELLPKGTGKGIEI